MAPTPPERSRSSDAPHGAWRDPDQMSVEELRAELRQRILLLEVLADTGGLSSVIMRLCERAGALAARSIEAELQRQDDELRSLGIVRVRNAVVVEDGEQARWSTYSIAARDAAMSSQYSGYALMRQIHPDWFGVGQEPDVAPPPPPRAVVEPTPAPPEPAAPAPLPPQGPPVVSSGVLRVELTAPLEADDSPTVQRYPYRRSAARSGDFLVVKLPAPAEVPRRTRRGFVALAKELLARLQQRPGD